jgi:hypothetical protein
VLDWINAHVGLEKYTEGRKKQGLEMGERMGEKKVAVR